MGTIKEKTNFTLEQKQEWSGDERDRSTEKAEKALFEMSRQVH